MNAVCELESKNYGEAMMSQGKHKWMNAVSEELKAFEENGLWEVMIPPTSSHVLHNKWVFETKTDANGDIERYKDRLVARGNEQLFGVDYTLTFAAVMELSTVKVILVLFTTMERVGTSWRCAQCICQSRKGTAFGSLHEASKRNED